MTTGDITRLCEARAAIRILDRSQPADCRRADLDEVTARYHEACLAHCNQQLVREIAR